MNERYCLGVFTKALVGIYDLCVNDLCFVVENIDMGQDDWKILTCLRYARFRFDEYFFEQVLTQVKSIGKLSLGRRCLSTEEKNFSKQFKEVIFSNAKLLAGEVGYVGNYTLESLMKKLLDKSFKKQLLETFCITRNLSENDGFWKEETNDEN